MENKKEKVKVSMSETLKKSFILWKDNFLKIALVITIVYIPVQILIGLASVGFQHVNEPSTVLSTSENLRQIANQNRIYSFIRQLIGVIATLGVFNFIYSILKNEIDDRNAFELVKFGLKKWPENFIQNLLAGFITILFTLLLIIPGIYKGVQYSFVTNIVSDEENEPLEKSIALVKDNWFNVFWMLILTFIIGLVIELILAIPFIFLPDNIVFTILLGVIVATVSSYTIVIKGVYYFELKTLKKENSDELNNIEKE